MVDGASIDYSQPIALAAPTAADSDSQAAADQATELLDAAHDAFLQGDYAGALSQCDKAIALQPNDALLHEFRGLALFALHRYDEAAGAVYAVLSAGPGWDWTTLSSLYPDVSVYTEQLRALEQYVAANPNSAAARFLLAYHYTICGHTDAAATQLKAAVQLDPKDRLSAQLLEMLTPTNARAPTPRARRAGQAGRGRRPRRRLEGHSRRRGHHRAEPYERRTVHLEVRPARQGAGVQRPLRGGRQPPDPQEGRHAGHDRPGELAAERSIQLQAARRQSERSRADLCPLSPISDWETPCWGWKVPMRAKARSYRLRFRKRR